MKNPATKCLRSLLGDDKLFIMPCCHDALSANLIENGLTPVLPPAELRQIGFSIAAYPLTLLQSIITAMESSLKSLAAGGHPTDLCSFAYAREVIGFPEYYDEEDRYSTS